jgi:hypothetical protein
MAQLIVLGGQLAGTALLGPGIGAALGSLAGSFLASALFPPPAQQGPRLNDRTVVGTEYGQGIPWVAGSPRLSGQIVWITNPVRETSNTQNVGKGAGQSVTTYTYDCDLLILLSENVTEGAARDWLNGELVRAGVTLKSGVWDAITVYTGADDQLPFPPYEAAVGVGNAPAFRGRTTIGITGLKLGNGKNLPNLEHQIAKSFVDDRIDFLVDFPRTGRADQSQWAIGNGSAVNSNQNASGFWACGGTGPGVDSTLTYQNTSFRNLTDPYCYEVICRAFGPLTSGEFRFGYLRFMGRTSSDNWLYGGSGAGLLYLNYEPGVAAGEVFDVASPNAADGSFHHFAIQRHGDNTQSVFWNGVRVVNHAAIGALSPNSSPATIQFGSQALMGGTGEVPAMQFKAARITRFNLYDSASFTPPTELTGNIVTGSVEENPVRMPELLSQLLLRAGYSEEQYEVTGLAAIEAWGYSTNDVTSTRAHLETLRPFGQYEANCSDKLYIFPRATTAAGTIPWADLGASDSPDADPDPFPLQLGSTAELPSQIIVRYRNVASGWNIGTEQSDRLPTQQTTTKTADLPFGMTPSQAKATVEGMVKDMLAGIGRVTLVVAGRKHAKYEPGDIIQTTNPNTGRTYRLRILTKRDSITLIEWECALDDASALSSPGITNEGYVNTTTPATIAPTLFEMIDVRPLQDGDATTPGPYVAMTPEIVNTNDEWPGAAFVRARLPGNFTQEFIAGDRCVIGTCTTTLGAWPKGSAGLQREGSLTVRVRGELSSASWADFVADRTLNAAIVGDEPIRFQRATFVSNDGVFKIYTLSNFLRGGIGEESRIAGHVANERFVLLNGNLRRMANVLTDLDDVHQLKAVTLNTLLSAVPDVDYTDTGRALRPISPWKLRAQVSGSDLAVSWARRSRVLARYTFSGTFTPLGETAEEYRLRIFDGLTLVRTVDLTSPSYTYTAANMAADGFTSGESITFNVVQISQLVGEGDATILTRTRP